MFTQDVKDVARAGEVKDVADGYARNFLIPRRLAVVAHKKIEIEAERLRTAATRRESKEREEAQAQAEEINDRTVVVRLKVGEEGKAFGSITSSDIGQALQQQHQVEIDRHRIELKEPIKSLGEHRVTIHLHRDVDATINLVVTQDR
jgi:large subunit ribosomal protein L9